MKVLLIDPWGANNLNYYDSGFINGMNKYVELDFVSTVQYTGTMPNNNFYPFFFKYSEMMKKNKIRTAVRGLEYILAWIKIIKLVANNAYDVIHVQWLLKYKIDIKFLNKLKSFTPKLVLTAHNIIPHTNGNLYIEQLDEIYGLFTDILVHGESIKKEFGQIFPQHIGKIHIQPHGEYEKQNISWNWENTYEFELIEDASKKYSKILIMLGFHFFNKGTDRLIHIWKEKFLNEDAMLLIIGKISNDYEELKNEVRNINARDNVVVIDKYVDDNLLNFAVYKSKCIILPYRHASMSGVIYSAAEYSKPVLCTNVGALPEYLEDGVDSFVCNNDDISLEMRLREIINIDSSQLKIMGEKLNDDIHRKYSWDNITKDLFEKIYVKEN